MVGIHLATMNKPVKHLEADLQVEIVLNDERMYAVYQNTLTDVNQGK